MTNRRIAIWQFLQKVHSPLLFKVARGLAMVVGVFLLFALGMRFAGPYLISSTVVRSAIERSITVWTGYRTEIHGDTDLAYWPTSRIIITDISIYDDRPGNTSPLMEIPRLVAFFDLFSMLRGVPDFSDFRISKPIVNLERQNDGSLNWSSKGRIAQAIAFFENADADVSKFPKDLDLSVGNIQIENGIINVSSIRGMTFSVSNVTASISWPHLSMPVTATMNAALNLNAFNLTATAKNPLSLLAGRNEPLDLQIASNAFDLGFSGITNLMHNGFIAGHVTMQAPSLADLGLYFGLSSEKTGALKDFNLDSDVSSEGSTLKLSRLKFNVASTSASGVMDIGLDPEKPLQINGTLAFDKFSVDKVVDAFGPSASGSMDTGFLQRIRMDLRLSADEATYAGLSLQKLAAGIRISDGRASLDIGESTFLGGTLNGRILIKDNSIAGTGGGQIDLHAEQIDLGGLSAAIGLPGPYPNAIGTVNLTAATDVALPKTRLSDYRGFLELSTLDGVLKNFDESQFRTLARKKKFFQLKEAEIGDYPFSSFSLLANFSDGIAEIKNVDVAGSDSEIALNGVVPYPEFSLALTGSIKKTLPTASDPDLNVFIGGTIASAVVSPISIAPDSKQ